MNAKTFADTIMHRTGNVKFMNVYLADRFYTNVYNKTVLPMKVIYTNNEGQFTIGFNELLEIFDRIPYISTNKSCTRQFTILSISCDETKEYEGHSYYPTRMRLIKLPDVIKACERLRDKIDERIREFKQETTLDLSDFDEL